MHLLFALVRASKDWHLAESCLSASSCAPYQITEGKGADCF